MAWLAIILSEARSSLRWSWGKLFRITVFGEEPHLALWDRVHLSEVFHGQRRSRISDDEWLIVRTDNLAFGISLNSLRKRRLISAAKLLVLKNGETLSYDKLCSATGLILLFHDSWPLNVTIPLLPDALKILMRLGFVRKQWRAVTVVGGGLLLEAANALKILVLKPVWWSSHTLDASTVRWKRPERPQGNETEGLDVKGLFTTRLDTRHCRRWNGFSSYWILQTASPWNGFNFVFCGYFALKTHLAKQSGFFRGWRACRGGHHH